MDSTGLLRAFRSPFRKKGVGEDRLAAPSVSQTSPGINPEPEEPPHYICPACGFEDEKKPFDCSKPCPKCKAHFLTSSADGTSLAEASASGREILRQIQGRDRDFLKSVGAKDYVLMPNGLRFKAKVEEHGPCWFQVILESDGTYTVSLSRLSEDLKWEDLDSRKGVNADELRRTFEFFQKGE
jgi:hypothetical protein